MSIEEYRTQIESKKEKIEEVKDKLRFLTEDYENL